MGILTSELLSSQLPDLLQQYQESLKDAPHTITDDVIMVLGLVSFGIYIFANVGLFRFRSWAPPLYLGSYAALMLFMLIDGEPYVATAAEEFFGEFAMLADGAVIAMAYLPSMREEFY